MIRLVLTGSYLIAVLSAGFSESAEADMNAPFPLNRKSFARDYDYALDSDLEDDGEDEADIELDSVQADMARLTVAVTDSGQSSDVGTPAVQVGEKPPLWPVKGKNAPGPEVARTFISSPSAADAETVTLCQGFTSPLPASSKDVVSVGPRKGRVVFIEDIAYRT